MSYQTILDRRNLQLGRLFTAGNDDLVILVRRMGEDPAFFDFNRIQNYGRYVGPDDYVIECVVNTKPPVTRRDGRLRLGVPVALLGDRDTLEVGVRVAGPYLAMIVEGVIVDEEWPAGPPVVPNSNFPGELPPLPPLTQYWIPPGHNCWAGDAMLTAAGDTLHLFWLVDRRTHGSKFGCGGCSFGHASTKNLAAWTHHPLAYPLTEYWEAACGTGCCVVKDGIYHVYSNPLTERLNLQEKHPTGAYLATSADGVHFTKQGKAVGLDGEPGILCDENGLWHAVAVSKHADGVWRSSRYESEDLRTWRMADPDFLPEPGWPTSRTVFSSECFNWFRWRDWFYIIGGRTGFWRSKSLLGPYLSTNDSGGPANDIYDGLCVPQVTVWGDRAILAGWLPRNEKDWAGCLVFRELRQTPDGDLEMFRLREVLLPEGAEIHQVELMPETIRELAGPHLDYRFDGPVAAEVVRVYEPKSDTTIFDFELAGKRTLILRRPGRAGIDAALGG